MLMRYTTAIFLSLWTTISASPPQSTTELLEKANQRLDAALYIQAIPLFQQVLDNPDSKNILSTRYDLDPIRKVRYSLAQAHFFSENYQGAVALLSEQNDLTPEELRLLAAAYRKMGQYEPATLALNSYLANSTSLSITTLEPSQFELALTYFMWGRLNTAQELFNRLTSNSSRYSLLSTLYLARIDLIAQHPTDAIQKLSVIEQAISNDDLLRFELSYLWGEALFQMQHYAEAAQRFEQALPHNHAKDQPWYPETLYHLGWSYLKMADNFNLNPVLQLQYFSKAESTLQTLLDAKPDERTFLALGQCYLAKAASLNDNSAYEHAEVLLTRRDIPLSRDAQKHVLLMRAEATPTFATRDALYRRLTHEMPLYAKGWYLRGLNDLEAGRSLLAANQVEEASTAFERALPSFEEAFILMEPIDKPSAALALKYQAQALILQNIPDKQRQALEILNTMLTENPKLLTSLDDPDEIYYLHAITAARLAESENEMDLQVDAENSLITGLKKYPKGKFADSMLLLLGTLYYHQQQNEKAENLFLNLATNFPDSPLAGDALFWTARCADHQNNVSKSKDYRRQVFEKYPDSTFAPEAYFTYYSYPEYLQGDRTAIKHLENMPSKYSDTPYLIQAKYLIGLDCKRDRKTAEGKWIRKKNLTASIDAFQEAEAAFDLLYQQKTLSEQEIDSLLTLRYRANLERALANLAIADESEGAKRQIYLEYAQEVLLQLCNDFSSQQHPLHFRLSNLEACHRIQEESSYWLAQAYLKAHNETEAERIFALMLENYRSAKITRGYFLSRTWYEKGLISMHHKDYQQALAYLTKSEESAKGNILDTDQRLDLWIQQSMCYRALNELENAILLLSKVINDDAISGLRIKAMYLRAEMYALQNRHDLARRQLEATSKKGGEWAQKAKEALEK